MAIDPIKTLEDLEDHLWAAAAVEFSTIPLYLYAMYSLKVSGEYARQSTMTPLSTFRGIAIEEMLHLCLVRNMYIAIGNGAASKRPMNFYDPALMPSYPMDMYLRAPKLVFNLRRYSYDQVKNTFMPLELPENLVPPTARSAAAGPAYPNLRAFFADVLAGSAPAGDAVADDARDTGEADPVRAAHLRGREVNDARAARAVPLSLLRAPGGATLAEADAHAAAPPRKQSYGSLGEFYDAIIKGFETVSESDPDLFKRYEADVNKQMPTKIYYSDPDGGGDVIRVVDLDSARACCTLIKDQGEGSAGDTPWVAMNYTTKPPYADTGTGAAYEPSHYYRFAQMGDGIYEIPASEVWPAMENPATWAFPPRVQQLSTLFNAAYAYLLVTLDDCFHTNTVDPTTDPKNPDATKPYTKEKFALIQSILSQMSGLLYILSDVLMRQPISESVHAGPTFEYHAFDAKKSFKTQLHELYEAAAVNWPELDERGIGKLIALLPEVKGAPHHG